MADFELEAFVTNQYAYNNGSLLGEWVRFPTTHEILAATLERNGIKPIKGGVNFITDYDCSMPEITKNLGEYVNLDELNYFASVCEKMSDAELTKLQGILEYDITYAGNTAGLINVAGNLDKYEFYPEIQDEADYGRYLISNSEMAVPEELTDYIDYESYGRDQIINDGGMLLNNGYIRDAGTQFDEVYDGKTENIPKEYLVTEKSESPEKKADRNINTDQNINADNMKRYMSGTSR